MSVLRKHGVTELQHYGKIRSFDGDGSMYQGIMKFEKRALCCGPSSTPCLDTLAVPVAQKAKSVSAFTINEGQVVTLSTPIAVSDAKGLKNALCEAFQKMSPEQEYNIKNIVEANADGSCTIFHVGQLTLTSITLDDGTELPSTRQCRIIQSCEYVLPVALSTTLPLTGNGGSANVDTTDVATTKATLEAALDALGYEWQEVVVEADAGSTPPQATISLVATAGFNAELDGVSFSKCDTFQCFADDV